MYNSYHLPLIFLSPASIMFSEKHKNICLFIRPLSVQSFVCLKLIIMSDFGMAESDDGLTPKIGRTGNLDAKLLFWGKRILSKNNIYKIFSIV